LEQEKIIRRSYLPGLIFGALGIFVLGIAASALLLHLEIYEPLDTHYRGVLSIISDVRETLIITTLKISGISSLLIILGLAGLVIFYTHRIAGPLHRVKACAKSIGQGSLGTKAKFREKDVIHPFAESLNEMTDCYSEKVKALGSEISQLKTAVTELKSLTEAGENTEAGLMKALDNDRHIKSIIESIRL